MEQDAPWAAQAGHEEAFSAEEDVPTAAHALDVVVDAIGKSREVAGADEQLLTGGELPFVEIAAAVDEHGARAGHALEEQPGPAE